MPVVTRPVPPMSDKRKRLADQARIAQRLAQAEAPERSGTGSSHD